MLIFPRPLRRRKFLDTISTDQKQAWVDDLYTRPLHSILWHPEDPARSFLQREVSFPLGSHIVTATVSEVIEFGPPTLSAGRGVDLTNPPFLPIWMCHGSGKNLPVYTLEELAREVARQPQCYGPTPEGPWYGRFADPWPWPWKEATQGVFAPSPSKTYAPGGPQAVFTRCSLIYHGRAIFVGALFLLQDSFTDEDLMSKGIVSKVQPHDYERLFEHELTHWWFMNQRLRDDYTRRYETGDLTGITWTVHPQPDTATPPASGDNLHPGLPDSRQPRDSRAHWKNWTDRQALREFQSAARKTRAAHLPITRAHLGKYLTTSRHRNTVREMLKYHGITLDDL